jgi:hypothetical protein
MRPLPRRARLAWLPAAALVIALLSPLVSQAPAEAAPGVPNTSFNSLWQNYGNSAICSSWSGGDSTDRLDLEVDLNGDGSVGDAQAWFFADTYLGKPAARYEDGGFFHSFVNNSIVIQKGNSLHTITGGNTCKEHDTSIENFWSRYAVSAITEADCTTTEHCSVNPSGTKFWNADATLTSSSQYHDTVAVFYYRVGPPKDGKPFTILNSLIATMPVNELVYDANGYLEDDSLQPIWCEGASEQVVWGANFHEISFGPDQIWGWGVNSNKLYYAEIPEGARLTNPSQWRYRTSGGFSSDCRLAKAQALTVGSAFEVFQNGGKWWLVQVAPQFPSGNIIAYQGTQPWNMTTTGAKLLYSAPELPHQSPNWTFIYDARVTSFGASKFTVSYNVNTSGVSIGCGSLNKWDASIYRPRFIDVPYSALTSTAAAPGAGVDAASTGGTQALSDADSPIYARGIRDARPAPEPRPGDAAAPARVAPEQFAPGKLVPDEVASRQAIPGQVASGQVASGKAAPGARAGERQAAGVLAADAPATAGASLAANNTWYDGWAYQSHSGCPNLESYAVQNLKGTIRPDGMVDLTWDLVGRDVWYWIYEKNVSESSSYKRYELWSYGPSATVAPLVSAGDNGDTFSYYVVGFASGSPDANGNGMPDIQSGQSNTVSGPVRMQPPAAPTGVAVTGTDYGAVQLKWNGVTYPTSQVFYWIRYWSDLESAPIRVGPWGADVRSAIVAPLASGHWYTFVVTAENIGGESAYSVGVSALVP